MKTIQLGKTAEQVSALCLGTMFFGSKTSAEQSLKILDAYYEAGGTFLDTANIYCRWYGEFVGGESETVLGDWIKNRKNRDKLFLASKMGFEYQDVPRSLKLEYVISECEKSLKRMKIDTIDLYYAHVDDLNTPAEEFLEAFTRLKSSGKIRFAGASNFSTWRLETCRQTALHNDFLEFSCIQQRHSFYRPQWNAIFGAQKVCTPELLEYCETNHLSLLAYSPLLSGAYSKSSQIPEKYHGGNDQRVSALKSIAEEKNCTVNQLILSWMLHSTPSVIPIFGVSSEQQLQENLGCLSIELSKEEMIQLA